MGKKSSSSASSSSVWSRGGWRYLHPSRYLKKPKRLALLIFAFLFLNYFLWDRRTLSSAHQLKVTELNQQVTSLQNQVQELKIKLRGAGVQRKIIGIGDNNINNIKKKEADLDDEDPINIERRQKVKEAMLHAWNAYEKYAWGQDELQPQTKNGVDSFGGLGATLVDSLDTLYIMGLKEQFQRAREWVANSLDFNKDYVASVFETTIRIVGGLLSAFDLSGDDIFLQKARDIADRLLPAWNTASGIPYNRINLAHGHAHNLRWAGI